LRQSFAREAGEWVVTIATVDRELIKDGRPTFGTSFSVDGEDFIGFIPLEEQFEICSIKRIRAPAPSLRDALIASGMRRARPTEVVVSQGVGGGFVLGSGTAPAAPQTHHHHVPVLPTPNMPMPVPMDASDFAYALRDSNHHQKVTVKIPGSDIRVPKDIMRLYLCLYPHVWFAKLQTQSIAEVRRQWNLALMELHEYVSRHTAFAPGQQETLMLAGQNVIMLLDGGYPTSKDQWIHHFSNIRAFLRVGIRMGLDNKAATDLGTAIDNGLHSNFLDFEQYVMDLQTAYRKAQEKRDEEAESTGRSFASGTKRDRTPHHFQARSNSARGSRHPASRGGRGGGPHSQSGEQRGGRGSFRGRGSAQ
jgi:hypothetical protein